ncbi:MAG: sigma 54-interacting transcriptional regulator, partial [Thermoanaerobaculia bacterium]|nr:sigma 54-interacting transcriptional regulator [Thermoanaerobaculia bacterium]
ADRLVLVICFGELPPPVQMVWDWLENGASEVLVYNQNPRIATEIRARFERRKEIDAILASPPVSKQIIGSSPRWRAVLRQVIEIAVFTQDSLLVLGESGTGKELIARLVHQLSRRPNKKELVLLDCSTIVPELSGSEFFGHEKGAFTNAIALREGAFCLADGGTLFLDEIGELPFSMQSELLRVIQEGTYKRVGSNHWKHTAFRLICATNKDLQQEIRQKQFREDLYYRISTWVIHLPPLRERREDIPEMVGYFLKKALNTEHPPGVDHLLMNYLITRDYGGNIRELQQLVTRIAHRYVGNGILTVSNLPAADRPNRSQISDPLEASEFINYLRRAVSSGISFKDIISNVSDTVKDVAIACAQGDLQLAAQLLDVSDRTMQMHRAARKQMLPPPGATEMPGATGP